jgi:hypothetical protein
MPFSTAALSSPPHWCMAVLTCRFFAELPVVTCRHCQQPNEILWPKETGFTTILEHRKP